MCGISGLATKRLGEIDLRATIERMANAIRHRGPDGMDVRCFEPPGISQRVALGHNRLAIIDVSQAGREPMTNEDGTVWLVFNGEIYNFQELRKHLESRGHRFHSRTDAEVIFEGERAKRRIPSCTAASDRDPRGINFFLGGEKLGRINAVIHINNAPISMQPISIFPTISCAPTVIYIDHREAPAGPILNLQIERARCRRGGSAMTFDDQWRQFIRRSRETWIVWWIKECIRVQPPFGWEFNRLGE